MRVALLLSIALLISGCGGDESYDRYSNGAEEAADAAAEAAHAAREAVYEEHGADSDGTNADASNVDAYAVTDGGNYTCTEDCSGHEAGFEWAQDNDINDVSDCGGNSHSFVEGCEAFAEERQEQADVEAQEAAELAAEEAEANADYDDEGEDY